MRKFLSFLMLLLFCATLVFAEGGKNLTPANTGTANGANRFIGYLQNGDANNSLSFLGAPGELNYNTDHILRIKVKAGETVYWGLNRNLVRGVSSNAIVRVQLRRLDDNTVVQTTDLTSASGEALDVGAGVINSYTEMAAGPAAIAGATGYNAVSYTVPTTIVGGIDLAFEVLDDLIGVDLRTFADRDVYHFWDISVFDGNTEKPGRLHSKFWSFSANSFTARLSTDFKMFTAVPDGGAVGKYFIKSIELGGMQPFGFFFAANSSGSNTNSAGGATTNYFERRKSKPANTPGASVSAFPEYFNFVNNPDVEFWPSATFRLPVITNQGKCHPTRASGGMSEITISTTDPVLCIILLNLNGVAGYQPGTRDVLIERDITTPGSTVVTWDGLDGLGVNVPSGTVVETFVRLGSFPVHYPLNDVENNSDGFALFEHRPNPPNTPAIAFWDDDAIVAGSRELFGVTSAGAVHPWGGNGAAGTIFANNIGDNTLMNTWMYGQLRQFQFFVFHVYDCTTKPPIASNFINKPILQTAATTILPPLVAADLDGTIANYTITSVPPISEGVLTYCTNGSVPCTGLVTTISGASTLLTAAQMATLSFDPTSDFHGQSQFTFLVTDNAGAISNTAVYKLPVIRNIPVADNIVHDVILNNNGQTGIQQLSAGDADGLIMDYIISSLPDPSACELRLNGTAVVLNQTILPTQISQLQIFPVAGYSGYASFTYYARDNSYNNSNTAIYSIPIFAGTRINLRPLANNIISQDLNSTDGVTAIPRLMANDKNGAIASYKILSIPNPSAGVLSIAGTAVTVGQDLTPNQATQLEFDPSINFVGKASFTYNAIDNDGEISNTATYTLVVVNQAPVASNLSATVTLNSGATKIQTINAMDMDGVIDSFAIVTIPPITQGVLYYCPAAPGACVPAAMTAITTPNVRLTTAQAATIVFDVETGFTGATNFSYFAIDNSGAYSQTANYQISVGKVRPVTVPLAAPTTPNSNGATAIPALSGSDVDGTVSYYTLHTIPDPLTQGTLYLSGVAVTPGQTVMPAQVGNLTFDPLPTFTGNVIINYSAYDNDNQISNLSQHILPVSGSGNILPYVFQLQNTAMNSSDGITALSSPLTGVDGDGAIVRYVVTTLPVASEGVLYLNGTAVMQFQQLTVLQASQLQFDPTPNFTGNASFTYLALDNTLALSTNSQYVIPVVNFSPISDCISNASLASTAGSSPISALVAVDFDGLIDNYVVATAPAIGLGTVRVGGNPLIAPATLTPAQAATLEFDPSIGFKGSIVLNFYGVDNNNNSSNVSPLTINITEVQPVAFNVLSPKMFNVVGPTNIPSLFGSDGDGTVPTYKVLNVPPTVQGVLLLNNVPVIAGQLLTPAEAANLQFDPDAGFVGDALFNFAAFDNVGNLSNAATFTIPIVVPRILPLNELEFNGSLTESTIQLNWRHSNEIDMLDYEVERSYHSGEFKKLRIFEAKNTALATHRFTDISLPSGKYHYRIKVRSKTGEIAYSRVLAFDITPIQSKISFFNNQLTLLYAGGINEKVTIAVIDASGRMISQKDMTVSTGVNRIPISDLRKGVSGVYFIKVMGKNPLENLILKIVE